MAGAFGLGQLFLHVAQGMHQLGVIVPGPHFTGCTRRRQFGEDHFAEGLLIRLSLMVDVVWNRACVLEFEAIAVRMDRVDRRGSAVSGWLFVRQLYTIGVHGLHIADLDIRIALIDPVAANDFEKSGLDQTLVARQDRLSGEAGSKR